MPVAVSYPGVYIEEIPSGVRTIVGVATSITAFLGTAEQGPVNVATTLTSFGDYQRTFGGFGSAGTGNTTSRGPYPMYYAVRDFFLNGGSQAIAIRLCSITAAPAAPAPAPAVAAAPAPAAPAVPAPAAPAPAAGTPPASPPPAASPPPPPPPPTPPNGTAAGTAYLSINNALPLNANSPGLWGNDLYVVCDQIGVSDTTTFFNMRVYAESSDPEDDPNLIEVIANVNCNKGDLRYVVDVLPNESSYLIALTPAQLPPNLPISGLPPTPQAEDNLIGGAESQAPAAADYLGDESTKTGIYALDNVDLFNLLCIPMGEGSDTLAQQVYKDVLPYCVQRRAFLIVDSPTTWESGNWQTGNGTVLSDLRNNPRTKKQKDITLTNTGSMQRNAALFYPRILQVDPLDGQTKRFPPCGIIAGVFANTDATRGVWKAPAGIDAGLVGADDLTIKLTDKENGLLNPVGINCLRSFPAYGDVVWGARTLRGDDLQADDYKYIPVRRLALYIEESLYRGTQWAVFEPNDEPLWAALRLNIGVFMRDLFRQGAFQGNTPKDAYFVKCDSETTTQSDINRGVVNVLIGFAPLKPAEFVVIQLQQMAGQLDT